MAGDSQNPLIESRDKIIKVLDKNPERTVVTVNVNEIGADFLLSDESCRVGRYAPAGTDRNPDGLGRKKISESLYEIAIWRPVKHA